MLLAIKGIHISQGSTGEVMPPLKRTNEVKDAVHISKKLFEMVGNFNVVLNKNRQLIISRAVAIKSNELIL